MKYTSDPKTERDNRIKDVSPQTLTPLVEALLQLWTTQEQYLLYCYVSNHILWFSNNPVNRGMHEAFTQMHRNQIQQCVSSRVNAAYIC